MNHIRLDLFDVDLVIIIITYLLVIYAQTGAGIFALSQGLLIDIFSGGLLGLFTLLYLTVFLGINLGSRLFDFRSVRGQVIIISLAVLLKGVLLISFLNIFSLDFQVSPSVFWVFATSAVCSGLIGPLVLYILNYLNTLIAGGAEGVSENSIQA
ncbi:MAG: hypothetical protein JSW15_03925 [Deltaproteobacteria bacterium]|nr:MAG: hypothetical protein JSW15_03925 [Deltaproteobacteria bacterium]